MTKRAYLIIHSPDGSVGSTLEWLNRRGEQFDIIDASTVDEWPRLNVDDSVIVFGGDMQAWETEKHSWLEGEKLFLSGAVKLGIPMFGICFGGQLLAEALGGEILDSERWEIGWYPLTTSDGRTFFGFAYHKSVFTLPTGADLVVTEHDFPSQCFKFGSVIGTQFHLELRSQEFEKLFNEWDSSLTGKVATLGETKRKSVEYVDDLKKEFFTRLDAWIQLGDSAKFHSPAAK